LKLLKGVTKVIVFVRIFCSGIKFEKKFAGGGMRGEAEVFCNICTVYIIVARTPILDGKQ
jgi:hypothetical protein